jgi:hypothetical protein
MIAVLPAVSAADRDPFIGPNLFPEFRNLSGLPGGGVGVLPNGRVSIQGALALSTPVAYSLGARQYQIVGANMSFDQQIRWVEWKGGQQDLSRMANGSAMVGAGFTVDNLNITASGLWLSGQWDNVLNLHFSSARPFGKIGFGVGVQDVFGHGGSSGDGIADDERTSSSLYAVATYEVSPGIYLSGGWGSRRFENGFGGASIGLGSYARAFAEYDGWHWNYGLGAAAGPLHVSLGQVAGKHTTWTIGLAFGFDKPSPYPWMR